MNIFKEETMKSKNTGRLKEEPPGATPIREAAGKVWNAQGRGRVEGVATWTNRRRHTAESQV